MNIQEIREIRKRMRRYENSWFKLRGEKFSGKNRDTMLELVDAWPVMYVELGETILNKKESVKNGSGSSSQFKGFINYVLNEDDKVRFKSWDVDDHDLWLLLSGDIQNGYKLTTSFNSQNDTYSATYMCNDASSPNLGFCLSAFAPDWYTAVKSLVFKHNEILGCVWGQEKVRDLSKWG